jgi:ElaB/YqjD/DUF883 family membrane-anchored ribosome-binding protein
MSAMAHIPPLFEALTETGIRPEAARRVEREMQASIAQGIAQHHADGHALLMTKADGTALENSLRAEMVEMKSGLRQEMTEMKSELRQEMTEMKSELRQEVAQMETRLMRYIHDHGWKMMGFQVATTGLMLTAFKYLH